MRFFSPPNTFPYSLYLLIGWPGGFIQASPPLRLRFMARLFLPPSSQGMRRSAFSTTFPAPFSSFFWREDTGKYFLVMGPGETSSLSALTAYQTVSLGGLIASFFLRCPSPRFSHEDLTKPNRWAVPLGVPPETRVQRSDLLHRPLRAGFNPPSRNGSQENTYRSSSIVLFLSLGDQRIPTKLQHPVGNPPPLIISYPPLTILSVVFF